MQASIEELTEVIETRPDYADAYFNRAVLYTTERRYEEAMADYAKAIELNPTDTGAYNNRGNL